MEKQYRYFEDPLKFEFEAKIVEVRPLDDGRYGVILDETFFYPTGGGQEFDRGVLGHEPVVDVWRDEATSQVVHVVEREMSPGLVLAKIDGERRLRHMQHHSAQHLVSATFTKLLELETLSAHISGYTASSIDLPETELSHEMLTQVEEYANCIVYENRGIKTYFVDQDQARAVPLRRPPKVAGDVRVVEIDGFDWSACGGTHCLSTGMIGLVKIIKTERQNKKSRVYFMAGAQALEYFQELHGQVSGLAEEMSIHWGDLAETVRAQADVLKGAQRELRAFQKERLESEAEALAASSQAVGDYRLVVGSFEDRPVEELQGLAKTLMEKDGMIAALATFDGEKLALVVARSADVDVHAGEFIKRLLEPVGGRGGGSQQMARGGGVISEVEFRSLMLDIDGLIR
ncbi:MAG: hypothetical protein ISR58_14875 [Anaerolineales bacterium]|nr:hypothetical protein [Chloroflexota bacterium]MBL6982460.1 hypothetical protein [Anaerolineales bacterium]